MYLISSNNFRGNLVAPTSTVLPSTESMFILSSLTENLAPLVSSKSSNVTLALIFL